ncbi:MAG: hypothetical protein ABIQ81_07535 [Novosphingobium sp.]
MKPIIADASTSAQFALVLASRVPASREPAARVLAFCADLGTISASQRKMERTSPCN